MTGVRPAAVAGTFYPADPSALTHTVDRLIGSADPRAHAPKALIVPHAGYVYSGPIAASAYRRLAGRAGQTTRVVLLGPAHTVALVGHAVSSADEWETPLGRVPIDDQLRTLAVETPEVSLADAPHAAEHSLEVQLPFLQRTLGTGFTLLPVVVGRAEPETTAALLDAVWGGDETVIIVSSDLSHYHDHVTATRLDRTTAAAITAIDPGAVGTSDACGAYPVRGLLSVAPRHHLRAELLDLRTSADTAGDAARVVGYGAFAFEAAA